MKLILNTLPICIAAIFLAACSMPKEIKENESITQQVINTPRLIQDHVLYMKGPNGDFKLHYVNSDPSNTPRDTLVFVHGTPGDWSSFARYFQNDAFKSRFRLTSIDRPGWGKSTYAGKFPTQLQTQSNIIGPMLKNIWERNGQQKIILVGHSLGGSLVPILAADYPDFVRGVVILAGDLKPELAQARWYNTVLDWTPNFLIPDMWNHSNMEVLDLTKSLEAEQAKLSKLTIPITILQGTDDTLVDPESAIYATSLFKNSDLKVEWIKGAGHIINLQHPDKVIEAIQEMNARSKQ
jgi:pimeloyl-ACP methyl ester carboxylesterase